MLTGVTSLSSVERRKDLAGRTGQAPPMVLNHLMLCGTPLPRKIPCPRPTARTLVIRRDANLSP